MKARAKDALAKLHAPPKDDSPTEAPELLFNRYFDSIKQAPVSLPSCATGIETRNTVWTKYHRA